MEPARRPRRKAEETREDILSMAKTLFRDNGFSKVAIADIAAALDMSPANVFKHFHSKANLVEAIVSRHLAQLTGRFDEMDEDLPAPDRLLHFFQKLMRSHLGDIQQMPYIFDMVVMKLQEDFPSGNCYRGLLKDRVTRIIEAGVTGGSYRDIDPDEMSSTIIDSMTCVLHPLLLAHTDATILEHRCLKLMEMVNGFLTDPLRSDD